MPEGGEISFVTHEEDTSVLPDNIEAIFFLPIFRAYGACEGAVVNVSRCGTKFFSRYTARVRAKIIIMMYKHTKSTIKIQRTEEFEGLNSALILLSRICRQEPCPG